MLQLQHGWHLCPRITSDQGVAFGPLWLNGFGSQDAIIAAVAQENVVAPDISGAYWPQNSIKSFTNVLANCRASAFSKWREISCGDFFIRSQRKKMSALKPVLTVERTKRSWASISSPRWEACASAMGLPMISSRDTNQSIAFFNPPGIARIYSGLAMIRPSLFAIRFTKRLTGCGNGAVSRSGENTGRFAISSNTDRVWPGGVTDARPLSRAVLVETDRALPDIARRFMPYE